MRVYERLSKGKTPITELTREELKAQIKREIELDREEIRKGVTHGLIVFAAVYIPLQIIVALLFR